LLEQHPCLQDDVLEFRYLLEASAAELAAQRATDADLERLEQAYAP
jgi:GntR family transcriptional repressor for pyruvate dehydrogenase complex